MEPDEKAQLAQLAGALLLQSLPRQGQAGGSDGGGAQGGGLQQVRIQPWLWPSLHLLQARRLPTSG